MKLEGRNVHALTRELILSRLFPLKLQQQAQAMTFEWFAQARTSFQLPQRVNFILAQHINPHTISSHHKQST